METTIITTNRDINTDRSVRKRFYHESSQVEVIENNPVYNKLAAEGCENFFDYIKWLGLAKNPNLVVLPSFHHYYYDAEDLKEVKTVVNLKLLNHIKQIKDFLHNIYHIMPYTSYFIGSFINRKSQNGLFTDPNKTQHNIRGNFDPVENGVASRIPFLNMMYSLMDSRTDRLMTERTVRLMLEDAGMKVLNMNELNGLTFFCVQKVRIAAE